MVGVRKESKLLQNTQTSQSRAVGRYIDLDSQLLEPDSGLEAQIEQTCNAINGGGGGLILARSLQEK